jgi:hypothetical protein
MVLVASAACADGRDVTNVMEAAATNNDVTSLRTRGLLLLWGILKWGEGAKRRKEVLRNYEI